MLANPITIQDNDPKYRVCKPSSDTETKSTISNLYGKTDKLFDGPEIFKCGDISSIYSSEDFECSKQRRLTLRDKVKKDTPIFKLGMFDKLRQTHMNQTKDCFDRIVVSKVDASSTKVSKSENAVIRYLKSQESQGKCEKELKHFELFKIFQYLNDRLILLNVIDKKRMRENDPKLNEKYISAYNSFLIPVTFRHVKYVNSYNGFEFYRANNIYTMVPYVLKKSEVNKDSIHSLDKSSLQLLHEARILARIQHPNIVRYFRSWVEYQAVYLQLEDPYGISLRELLRMRSQEKYAAQRTPIADVFVLKMIAKMLSAMYYLYDNSICVHGSVNLINIWVKCHTLQLQWNSLSDPNNEPYVSFLLFNFEGASSCRQSNALNILNNDFRSMRIVAFQMIFDSENSEPREIENWESQLETRTKNDELIAKLQILKEYFD